MVQFPLVLLLKVLTREEKLPKVPLVRRAVRVDKSELPVITSTREFPPCARAEVAKRAVAATAEVLKYMSIKIRIDG